MLNTINVNLNTDLKVSRVPDLGIKIKSQDINNNLFILRFTDKGKAIELDETYTVEILTKFEKSKSHRLTSATVYRDYARWEFDTSFITMDEKVVNHVYVRKSGILVVSADANAFAFDVGLSEIDKDAGRVAEVYDENYQRYLDEFKDNVDFEEIAQAEQARKEAELLREENYNQKVDTAIVEADVVAKVDNKVTELTPQINDLTAQLAQKALQSDLEIEKGRISNLVTNAGDTDGNAELLDIRVGDDAVIYDTAGDAFRQRVGKAHEEISNILNANLKNVENLLTLKSGVKDEIRLNDNGEYEIFKRVYIHKIERLDVASITVRANYVQVGINTALFDKPAVPSITAIQGTFDIEGWTEKRYTVEGEYVPNVFSTRPNTELTFDLPLGTDIENARDILEGLELKYQVNEPFVISLASKNVNTKQVAKLRKEVDDLYRNMSLDAFDPILFDNFTILGDLVKTEVGDRKYIGDSDSFVKTSDGVRLKAGVTGIKNAFLDYGNGNCVIESDVKINGETGGAGLSLRALNNQNRLYVRVETYNIRLYKRVADKDTLIGVHNATVGVFTDFNLKVSLNGDSIKVFADGILVIDVKNPYNKNETLHGFYSQNSEVIFKNFSIAPYREISAYQIEENFESYPLPWYFKFQESEKPYSKTLSSNYALVGDKSMRFELRREDAPSIYRSELALPAVPQLSERWYSVSILLPNGGDEDYGIETTSNEVILQWHNTPDEGETGSFSPPLSLTTTSDGRYSLNRAWDDGEITTHQRLTEKGYKESHDLGSFIEDKGKWVDWSFHIKWGWLREQAPFIEVYKDGVRVLEVKDKPNTFNDLYGTYWKMGIYKFALSYETPMDLEKRVVYYDKLSTY